MSEATTHVVSLSGGTASAVAAARVLERYGHSKVILWFADTSWEDEGLYRFLDDLERYWQHPIIRHREGPTPLEIAEKKSIIPNQKRAPCALELKIKPFTRYIKGLPSPVTIHLGLDWTEQHRSVRPKKEYESIPGVTVDLPLMWDPIARPPHRLETERWGIKTPRLYDLGFSHNNCGGRCVKQGIQEWVRLKRTFPERFVEVRDWEEMQRAKGGARANYAIARDQSNGTVKPLPMTDLEKRYADGQQLMLDDNSQDDRFACVCSY
jgi:hypothetical protein